MTRWLGITLHHLRFIGLSFWRNPTAAFFGIAFPLMILAINSAVFGGNSTRIHGEVVPFTAFYVARMSVFAVVMTCLTNLATSVAYDRDMGRLKRIRGTPTPVSAYVSARLLFAICVGLFTTLLCVAVGMLFFGVQVSGQHLAVFLLTMLAGSISLGGIALAIVAVIPNAQAAPAILNAATFPILFLSSVFFPITNMPAWLNAITHALPVRPLANAAMDAFFGDGPELSDLAILLCWGTISAVIAARFFRWQPSR